MTCPSLGEGPLHDWDLDPPLWAADSETVPLAGWRRLSAPRVDRPYSGVNTRRGVDGLGRRG